MTITAREFLKRMDADQSFAHAPRCVCCSQVLSESVTGNRAISGEGFADSDCYFELLSKVVEESPIRTARIRKG